MNKVSIIVPVYNKFHRIDAMVESIVSQSYENIELLLIDDGSTDGSNILCDNWAKRDSRVKVFHKENAGVSSARNLGIEKATGYYLMFCDADDCLLENGIASLVQTAETSSADLVVGGIVEYIVDETKALLTVKRSLSRPSMQVEKECFSSQLPLFWKEENMASSCGKLYLRSLISSNHLFFNTKKIVLEDFDFVLNYCEHCTKIVSGDAFVYLYYQSMGKPVWEKRSSTDFVDDVASSYDNLNAYVSRLHLKDDTPFWTYALAWSAGAAYQGVWALPASDKTEKKRKYKRIKTILSYPVIQKYLSQKPLPKLEGLLLRKSNIVGLLCLYKLRSFWGK